MYQSEYSNKRVAIKVETRHGSQQIGNDFRLADNSLIMPANLCQDDDGQWCVDQWDVPKK